MLPAASAGAIRQVESISGAFHGMISAGDADRLADRVVEELVADLERAAVQLADHTRVVVEVLRRARREPLHLRDRHADVGDLARDELLRRGRGSRPRSGEATAARSEAFIRGHGAFVERLACGGDGRVDPRPRPPAAASASTSLVAGFSVSNVAPETLGAKGAVDVVLLKLPPLAVSGRLDPGGLAGHRPIIYLFRLHSRDAEPSHFVMFSHVIFDTPPPSPRHLDRA